MAKPKFSVVFKKYDASGLGILPSGLGVFFEYKKIWREIATLVPSANGWAYQTGLSESISIAEPFRQDGYLIDLTENLRDALEEEFEKLRPLVKDKDIPSGGVGVQYKIRIARFLFKTSASVLKTQSGLILEVQGENIGSALIEINKFYLKTITLAEFESYFSDIELLRTACEAALRTPAL